MVKFSKQLEAQLVPEWRAAYVTYKLLKKDLNLIKDVGDSQRGSESSPQLLRTGSNRRFSNFTRLHGSLENFVASTGEAMMAGLSGRRSHRNSGIIIQVNRVDGGDPCESYETVLVEHNDLDATFFAHLDSQFNKVNQFYRSKEKDFIDHAGALEKQMQGLIEMRRVLADRQRYQGLAAYLCEDNPNAMEAGQVLSARGTDGNALGPNESNTDMGQISNGTVSGVVGSEERGECSSSYQEQPLESKNKPISPQLTMRMKTPTTPGATISMLSHNLWEDIIKQVNKSASSHLDAEKTGDELVVTKKKIQIAEKMLRVAFIEYYRGLGMLKSYSSLNMVAFAKILKKYDKISGKRAASVYLKAIETSYFNTSDKVIALMDEVETLFTKYFANDNHRKAMINLRPRQKKASHSVTFTLGLFSGGSLALLVVFVVLAQNALPRYKTRDSADQSAAPDLDGTSYFETVFPAFSMVALLVIHIYGYGVNLYFWRRMRINFQFIFEFQPGTELRHREVLMVASILTTLLMGAMVGQLSLHSSTGSPLFDLIPFLLVLMLMILLVIPLNICYRSSRLFLLTALLHVAGSPLYKVALADFFLADQLTSQAPMLRNAVHIACYYMGGFFKTGRAARCLESNSYRAFIYLISVLPYWWRLMQCVRRFFDEADKVHVVNGGKYLSSLVAVAIRIQYGVVSTRPWLAMTIVSSTMATIYQLYWDLVVDWGLLRRQSKNPWLRDQLIMPKHKYIYFVSMIVNTFLRMAWLQSVTRFKIAGVDQQVTDFGFASLEVIRRGHWNFYRLENEHLNNVGNYRATKTVPLPFENPTTEEED